MHTRGQWPEEAAVDSVTLAFLDRHRRRIRLVADSGTPFLLDLSTFSPLQMLAGAHVVAAGLLFPLALLERPWQSFAGASWVAVVVRERVGNIPNDQGWQSTVSTELVILRNQGQRFLLNTSAPLDHALFSYLTSRERLTRVR